MARINERCALAYQHDVRGTLQAVYSTVELLKRSLAAQAPDPARIKKVSELASSALQRHEESTLAMLDTLTLHHLPPTALDLGYLVDARTPTSVSAVLWRQHRWVYLDIRGRIHDATASGLSNAAC